MLTLFISLQTKFIQKMDIQADFAPEKGLIFHNKEEMRKFISTYKSRTLSKYVI